MLEMSDKEREDAIDRHRLALEHAKTPAARRREWRQLQRLVKGRSRRQQTRMALDQGLPVHTGHPQDE